MFELIDVEKPKNVNLSVTVNSWLPRLTDTDHSLEALAQSGIAIPDNVMHVLKCADKVLFTGSAYIVKPNHNPSDVDIMIYSRNNPDNIKAWLNVYLAVPTLSDYPDDLMLSYRIGIFNILVAFDHAYFYRWQVATDIAKRLNLKNKDDRAYLFERLTTM